jgi:multisubunit Na+/H+ antiporter MnhC subunit
MTPMDASIALTTASDGSAPPSAAPLPEPLFTAQTLIAMAGVLIVAGTIAGVFLKGDQATLQLVIGLVIGAFGSPVFQFYFGSSKGSQRKDEAKIAQDAKTTTIGATTPSA